MADICMCKNDKCLFTSNCWRFNAPPTPEWQAYFLEDVRNLDGDCDYFIECRKDELGRIYPVMKGEEE